MSPETGAGPSAVSIRPAIAASAREPGPNRRLRSSWSMTARASATMRARSAGGELGARAAMWPRPRLSRRSGTAAGSRSRRAWMRVPRRRASRMKGPSHGRAARSAAPSALEGRIGGSGSGSAGTGRVSQPGAAAAAAVAATFAAAGGADGPRRQVRCSVKGGAPRSTPPASETRPRRNHLAPGFRRRERCRRCGTGRSRACPWRGSSRRRAGGCAPRGRGRAAQRAPPRSPHCRRILPATRPGSRSRADPRPEPGRGRGRGPRNRR